MSRDLLARIVIRLYPPTWRADGRTEEIAEALTQTRDRDGPIPRRESTNVAVHAAAARFGWWLPKQVRTRIADLSAITGGGLAGVLFVFGEWQPWATQHDSWLKPQVGPFLTPGAFGYLLLIATTLCYWVGPAALTGLLCLATVAVDIGVALLPTVTGFTRPSLLALGATAAFATGIAVGAVRRSHRGIGIRATGIAATVISGLVTGWAVICHADLSYDDRGSFNWDYHGLADIARYIPTAVAIALSVAVLLLPVDHALLIATTVVAMPWCLIGLRQADPSSVSAYGWLTAAIWCVALASLHAIHVGRQRVLRGH